MLEHEPQNQPNSQAQPQQQNPAGDTRVTAEEFAAAIDALEKRKAEDANRLAGTVAIGETIRELHVDATPEEILKEVELQRARRAAEALRIKSASDARAKMASDALSAVRDGVKGAFGPKVGPVQTYQGTNQPPQNFRDQREAWREQRKQQRHGGWFGPTIGSIAFAWFMFSMMSGHLIHGFPFDISSSSDKPFVATTTLAQVPEGRTVYVNTDGLHTIITNGGVPNSASKSVGAAMDEESNTWPVTLQNGKYYLDGFIPSMNMSQMVAAPLDVYNDNNSGELHGNEDNDVHLSLEGVHLDSYSPRSNYSEVVLDNVKVDPLTKDD